MATATVTFELTGAWESWTVEVPDELASATPDEVLAWLQRQQDSQGDATRPIDFELLGLQDSGNTSMSPVNVESVE